MPGTETKLGRRLLLIIRFSYKPTAFWISKPGSPLFANFCQFFLQIWVKTGQIQVEVQGIIVDFKKEGVLKIAHPRMKNAARPNRRRQSF
jgi:hypothetical protein